jgi:HSP20 family protein
MYHLQEGDMANIVRRQEQQPMERAEWEPFRALRELLRWDPFGEMMPMARGEEGFVPRFDVKETPDSFVFKADLPGVKESDLDISLTGNRLTISGKRESTREEGYENSRYYAYERSYGTFSRSFTLPMGHDAEGVKAELKNGELTVMVPKKPEAQPKRITVGSGGGEKQKAKA